MRVRELSLPDTTANVSWRSKPIPFYLHVLDRSKLKEYLRRQKYPEEYPSSSTPSPEGEQEDVSDNPLDCTFKSSITTDDTSDEVFDAGRYSTPQERRGLKKIIKIKRSRDPTKEIKGFLTKESSAASSPTGSCFGKSPSLSSVVSAGNHVITAAGGSMEHLTSSLSTDHFRSTRSATAAAAAAAAATRDSPPLREITLKECQINLPRFSSNFAINTTAIGEGSGLAVTSPKRKNLSSSSTAIKTIEHNILQKFSGACMSMQAVNCAACKTAIKRGHNSMKCKYCKVACHPKCAADLPNTCGLPAELADHKFAQPPSSKMLKIDSQDKHTAVEYVQIRKEGWLKVYHQGKYNGSQEWVVISDNRICCYSRREFNRDTSRNVKAILPLCNPSIITVLHATLKRNTTTPSFNSKEAFAIEQLGHNNDIMTYSEVDSTSNKKGLDWCIGKCPARNICKEK